MGSLKRRLEGQVCREKSGARSCAAWSRRSHPPARQDYHPAHNAPAGSYADATGQVGDDTLENGSDTLVYHTDTLPLGLRAYGTLTRRLRGSSRLRGSARRRLIKIVRVASACRRIPRRSHRAATPRRHHSGNRLTHRTGSGDGGGEGDDGDVATTDLIIPAGAVRVPRAPRSLASLCRYCSRCGVMPRPTKRTPLIPPHDSAAEAAVLGVALLETAAVSRVVERLRPTDFFTDATSHRSDGRAPCCNLSRLPMEFVDTTLRQIWDQSVLRSRIGARKPERVGTKCVSYSAVSLRWTVASQMAWDRFGQTASFRSAVKSAAHESASSGTLDPTLRRGRITLRHLRLAFVPTQPPLRRAANRDDVRPPHSNRTLASSS